MRLADNPKQSIDHYCRGCPHVRYGCPKGLDRKAVGPYGSGQPGPLSDFLGIPNAGERCVSRSDDGVIVRLSVVSCRRAQEQGHLCPNCAVHDWKPITLPGGMWQGRACRIILVRGHPEPCQHDGERKKDWPLGINPDAKMPEGTMVGVIRDAVRMSLADTAKRHGVSEAKVSALFRSFADFFESHYRPKMPPGFAYLSFDIAEFQGKRHLIVAAIAPTEVEEMVSRVILVLPISADLFDEAVAALQSIEGLEQLAAVSTDLDDFLLRL